MKKKDNLLSKSIIKTKVQKFKTPNSESDRCASNITNLVSNSIYNMSENGKLRNKRTSLYNINSAYAQQKRFFTINKNSNIEDNKKIMRLQNIIREKDRIILMKDVIIKEREIENKILKFKNKVKSPNILQKYKGISNKYITNLPNKKNVISKENSFTFINKNLIMNSNNSNNNEHIEYNNTNLDINRPENQLIEYSNINPDEMTYEELLELQEKIGFVNRGFSKQEISKLPIIIYIEDSSEVEFDLLCTICQYEYKIQDKLRKLTCNHKFHIDCVDPWLTKEKTCPNCKEDIINI